MCVLGTEIGKVVKSNSHIDYVCQVYGRGETQSAPQPAEYALGTFVAVSLGANAFLPSDRLIGVIYNTVLVNPDFGNMGPRLSPQHDLEVFSPDYLAETATLVGILLLGWQEANGACRQGAPLVSATVNQPVQLLDDATVQAFHAATNGNVCLRYLPLLLAQNNPLTPTLAFSIIDRLVGLFPTHQKQLALVRDNLAWKSIVQPAA
jgi:hypothetical protein